MDRSVSNKSWEDNQRMVEHRLSVLETWVENADKRKVFEIKEGIDFIVERMSRGSRPPWNVVWIITTLTSLVTLLLGIFVSKMLE